MSRKHKSNNSKGISLYSPNESAAALTKLYNTRDLQFRTAQVFPPHFRTTLTYYEQVNFSLVSTPQTYVFRGNGPYDPNQTGTGNQPVGYDNLSTFYDSVYAIGSKISITVANQTTQILQVALAPTISTSMITAYDQSQYYPGVKKINVDGTTRGGNSFKRITNQLSTLRFFSEPFDNDFVSLVTTIPARQWYWTIAMQTADTVSALTLNMQVQISYDVVFIGRKLVLLS